MENERALCVTFNTFFNYKNYLCTFYGVTRIWGKVRCFVI